MSCTQDNRRVAIKLGELEILHSGVTVCEGGHSHGPVSAPNWGLHFNTKGKCRYIIESGEFTVGPGEGFLICPEQINTYIADEDDPCTFNFIIFRGSVGEELIRAASLNEDKVMFRFETGGELIRAVDRIHSRCSIPGYSGYDVISDFILVMHLIAKSAPEVDAAAGRRGNAYIENALGFIESHYPYNFTISELAASVGVDRCYLYKLFIEHFGASPSSYVSDFRLKKAILLMEQGLPVTVVALSTGFCNASHFIRKFVARYGMTPSEYRRKMK